jgi:hypothetical protein
LGVVQERVGTISTSWQLKKITRQAMCIMWIVLLCTILVAGFARFKKKTSLKPGRVSPVSVLLDTSMIISKTASNLNHKSGIAEQMG